jgi:hypothetical protein
VGAEFTGTWKALLRQRRDAAPQPEIRLPQRACRLGRSLARAAGHDGGARDDP